MSRGASCRANVEKLRTTRLLRSPFPAYQVKEVRRDRKQGQSGKAPVEPTRALKPFESYMTYVQMLLDSDDGVQTPGQEACACAGRERELNPGGHALRLRTLFSDLVSHPSPFEMCCEA